MDSDAVDQSLQESYSWLRDEVEALSSPGTSSLRRSRSFLVCNQRFRVTVTLTLGPPDFSTARLTKVPGSGTAPTPPRKSANNSTTTSSLFRVQQSISPGM